MKRRLWVVERQLRSGFIHDIKWLWCAKTPSTRNSSMYQCDTTSLYLVGFEVQRSFQEPQFARPTIAFLTPLRPDPFELPYASLSAPVQFYAWPFALTGGFWR